MISLNHRRKSSLEIFFFFQLSSCHKISKLLFRNPQEAFNYLNTSSLFTAFLLNNRDEKEDVESVKHFHGKFAVKITKRHKSKNRVLIKTKRVLAFFSTVRTNVEEKSAT